MANNSDYNKPRMNLFERLPEVLQSETNQALFENTFNRFLTKQETRRVAGYIGQGNPEAIRSRQIDEFTVHRQAYQLQPTLYNKIGSIEWISSWKDLLNEAERLGIDEDRLPDWLNLLKFNWVPPIDLDKLIHYRDYYWVDSENPGSRPQYITIRSRCVTATAFANFLQLLVDEFGATIPTARALSVDSVLPEFSIVSIDGTANEVVVRGNVTDDLQGGEFFEIQGTTGTPSNDGTYQVNGTLTYDSGTDLTTIPVAGTLTTEGLGSPVSGSPDSIGQLVLIRFDKLVISGEFIRLLDPGFVFFYKNSTNAELDGAFWRVVDSEYDEDANETIITINTTFTNSIVDGVISQEERLDDAIQDQNCFCNGSVGWDILQWDDNPDDPLWDGDHQTLIQAISNNGSPVGSPSAPGTEGELWWDVDADRLYQYNGTEWVKLWDNFSTLVEDTNGLNRWDLTTGCGNQFDVTGSEQWIQENKWVHKSNVSNFSTAKQAQVPIIEFQWDLELNEWTFTTLQFGYRKDNSQAWTTVEQRPELIELIPLEFWTQSTDGLIVLDERYGDLTGYFTPGRQFMGIGVSEIFEVEYSVYKGDVAGEQRRTHIKMTVPITGSGLSPSTGSPEQLDTIGSPNSASTTPLRPVETSFGDPWKDYGEHWTFDRETDTVAVNHQPRNVLAEIPTDAPLELAPSGSYEFSRTYYAQDANIVTNGVTDIDLDPRISEGDFSLLPGTNRTLRERALLGFDDIRVYVNGVRQYGTYDEKDEDGNGFVTGISFVAGTGLSIFDTVRIEVGSATPVGIGYEFVSVRTTRDDVEYNTIGDQRLSLIQYRKAEQVKTEINQFPRFDIYNVDGTSTTRAETLFRYLTDDDVEVNAAVGQRLATDTNSTDFLFEQLLLDDDGTMYAYRDYENRDAQIWVDPEEEEVWFWDGLTWSQKVEIGPYYEDAIVSDTNPGLPWTEIDGFYWYDTLERTLKRRRAAGSPGTWETISDGVIFLQSDQTLQTIWRKGLNDERFNPTLRDWQRRSLEEYNDQKDIFVERRVDELTVLGLTESEATTQAEEEWFESQENHLSPDGQWIGDWDLPDPLYYNVSHENRQVLSFRELLSHFNTIVQEQPKIPGFIGPRENMFHLIPINEVNYGLGGKIREYNNGFDTFLSSLFVNNVTPRALYEFAQEQYESLLNNVKELLRREAFDLLTDTSEDALADQTSFIVEQIIEEHEQNDALALIYGDSTTFTEVDGPDDLGVRNWIATLPYIEMLRAVRPYSFVDSALNITQIVHHDGHRNNYGFESAVRRGIVRQLVNHPDSRTASDTFGRISTDRPPNNVAEFESAFATQITDREGVYWLYNDGTADTLYRLNLVRIGDTTPSLSNPEGSLWLDTTTGLEVLRIRTTDPNTGVVSWNVVDGLTPGATPIRLHNGTGSPPDITTATVSAWQIVDIDSILQSIILEVEQRLFDNAPDPFELRYSIDQLEQTYPQLFSQLTEEAFLTFANRNGIIAPFANDDFTLSNPFTWNYKFSGPGQSFQIVDVDAVNDTITVSGDVSILNVISTFYIKNSDVNDGTWIVSSATYNSGTNTTLIVIDTVTTEREVVDSEFGIVYVTALGQKLPSPILENTISERLANLNDGGESGGDWRDYYQKLYRTPYPHREPWRLQKFDQKPTWWDEEYLNDDTQKWGSRYWKYSHGFSIVGSDTVADYFQIEGDFREVFGFIELNRFDPVTANTKPVFRVGQSVGTPSNDGKWEVGTIEPVTAVSVGSAGTATITVPGDYTSLFTTGLKFAVTGSTPNVGTIQQLLTVKSSVFASVGGSPAATGSPLAGSPAGETIITVEEEVTTSANYDFVGGMTYDPSTNRTTICINTSSVVPGVNTDVVGGADGRIEIRFGMWENIRVGRLPDGRDLPVGVTELPIFNYFSVNIGNDTITDGGTYAPDDVIAPFWDPTDHFGGGVAPVFDRSIRSVFTAFSQIVSPGADFAFGDAGPREWAWRETTQFLYDQLGIAFQLDPVRFMYMTFGPKFHEIDDLLIDDRQNQVLSHTNTLFHGDLSGGQPLEFSGTNQWYVNFARFSNVDLSQSDFRSMWTDWTTPLMYQLSTFVDTPSFELGHRQVCMSEFDYRITSKQSRGVEDFWIDSFEIVFVRVPPKIIQFDNDRDWELEIRTRSPVGKAISYFDVENFQFHVNTSTDTCTLYTWDIVGVDIFNNTFSINGDQTRVFRDSTEFEVNGSSGNDGTYEILTVSYDSSQDITIIQVDDVTNSSITGVITVNYRVIPWNTGDIVVLSTTESLPVPLQGDNVNGVFQYFVIVLNDNQFQLALTRQDAISGNSIDITSIGRGEHFVGRLANTFSTPRTNKNWRHYVVDTRHLLSFTPPHGIRGIQTLINIVDGYERYKETQGWRINVDDEFNDFDQPSRLVSWQLELERLIDFGVGLRIAKMSVNDRYEATVDVATDGWTFTTSTPQFITGDPITVVSSNSVFPTPFERGGRYYMIRDSLLNFRIAATKTDAQNGIAIDVGSLSGVGTLSIAAASNLRKDRPQFEINPFRRGVWFRPDRGIVSNLLEGPVKDAASSQLLLDQFGRPLGRDLIRIFREDKETAIKIKEGVSNDVRLSSVFPSPYNFIHLAAAHLFIDTFEHILIFNGETTEGQLVYDPFLGLNLTKFELLFNRQVEFTQRPNVGGHYLSTFFNQGADLSRNFEAQVEDLREAYDTYRAIEANDLVSASRDSLGYEGRRDHFDLINMSAKSQFTFWRGMIQNKGSVNSINAFINSRRFIDAKVDEFWAFKVAEFGSAAEKEFISLWLFTRDALSNDLRLEFLSGNNLCNAGFDTNPYDDPNCGYAFPNEGEAVLIGDPGFTTVTLTDEERWFEQPDQLQKLRDNGGQMYFELKPVEKIDIYLGSEPPRDQVRDGDGWIENIGGSPETFVFQRWDDTIETGSPTLLGDWSERTHGTWTSGELPILRHNTESDFLTITTQWYEPGYRVTRYTPWDREVIEVRIDVTVVGSPGGSPFITRDEIVVSGDITNVAFEGMQITVNDGSPPSTFTVESFRLEGGNTVFVVAEEPTFTVGSPAPVASFAGSDGITSKEVPVDPYIPFADSIQVFKNGVFQESGVDYNEVLGDTGLLATKILIPDSLFEDRVEVVYTTSNLEEGVHFNRLTSNIVELTTNELVTGLPVGSPQVQNANRQLKLWAWTTDEDPQSPAKIIDRESEVALTPVQLWDPARGHHFYRGIHAVDLQRDTDPAIYTDTLIADQTPPPIPDFTRVYFDPWRAPEVGTVWLDTTNLEYVPYYDTFVFTDTDTRARLWGRLADWGEVRILTWVESDVPPDEWDALAAEEEIDSSIPEGERKSGRVVKTLFEQNAAGEFVFVERKFDEFDVEIEGSGVGTNTFELTNIINRTSDVTAVDGVEQTITMEGDFTRRLLVGTTIEVFNTSTLASTLFTVDLVELDGSNTVITVVEPVALTFPAPLEVRFYEPVNVYINGSLAEENALVDPSGVIAVDDLVLTDRVRIMQLVPTDRDFIDAEIEAGNLFEQVQFTQETNFSDTGIEQTRYYFWVRDKAVREGDRLPPIEAETRLELIPIPYMFFQNAVDRSVTPAVVNEQGSPTEISFASERIELPIRFTRVIVRGLGGLINADFRYTLRWTRDFTLRDSLDQGETPLQKKNKHEEWQLLRRDQNNTIPRWLWDKVTEAIVGFELDNTSTRVPSLDREEYDEVNNTGTRIGIDRGQAIADGDLARATILADLNNPNNNFSPVDINVFFLNNSFDTTTETIEAMDQIYNTFPPLAVNRMFFDVLLDGFSSQSKYEGIFKTSMVALHGVRTFQVAGLFDD